MSRGLIVTRRKMVVSNLKGKDLIMYLPNMSDVIKHRQKKPNQITKTLNRYDIVCSHQTRKIND